MSEPRTFLSRWARRKSEHRREQVQEQPEQQAKQQERGQPSQGPASGLGQERAAGEELRAGSPAPGAAGGRDSRPDADGSLPGLDGVPGELEAADSAAELPALDTLRPDSDFRPFMRAGVDPATRGAALKRLFGDPHFNRMDGLDIYIDDYGKPDPIPAAMLRMLEQSRSLGLFRDDEPGPETDSRTREPADGGPPDPDRETQAARSAEDVAPASGSQSGVIERGVEDDGAKREEPGDHVQARSAGVAARERSPSDGTQANSGDGTGADREARRER